METGLMRLLNQIVINVGDMLSRHTNKLKSTIHSGKSTKRIMGTSRYSVPFFHAPSEWYAIELFRKLYWCKNPKQFDDITAGDYLYERLVDLGLIKIIPNFT
jgi:isopenicillin N synthase-like dioxygenase